jgi:hypothetical protein
MLPDLLTVHCKLVWPDILPWGTHPIMPWFSAVSLPPFPHAIEWSQGLDTAVLHRLDSTQ